MGRSVCTAASKVSGLGFQHPGCLALVLRRGACDPHSMKILIAFAVLALGVGCGGGSQYAMATTPGQDGKTVMLSTWVVPVAGNDTTDSLQVAIAGAGCQITKAKYKSQQNHSIEFVEGTCDNFAIKFKVDQVPSSGRIRVHAECDVAVGEGPCKAAFTRVLESAQSARYIQ